LGAGLILRHAQINDFEGTGRSNRKESNLAGVGALLCCHAFSGTEMLEGAVTEEYQVRCLTFPDQPQKDWVVIGKLTTTG
jgi:hypothetical protein